MSQNNSIYLVDGSSLAFRSFFALITSKLRRSDGTATWAIIGFFNSLFQLVEQRNPHCLAVSFDLSGPTFRHEQFADYKATRNQMPDDLKVQWPIIREGVKVLGIPLYEISGYEADDVIGTVAKNAESKGMKPVIFTGDKDAFQLLENGIEVLMPTTTEGVKEFNRQGVFDKLGVWPEQVIDYKGLVGDTSDNIPGVRGIGPKTAAQLLGDYQTLTGIYENLDKIKSNSVREKLQNGKEIAFISKDLATIRLDVPIEFDFEHCKLQYENLDDVVRFFRENECNAILKRLPRVLKYFNGGVEPVISSELLEPIGKGGASTRSRVPMAKQVAAVGEAEAPATRSGGVAVAEQRTLDLTVPTRVTANIGELNLPEPQIVRSEAALQALVSDLQAQQVIAMEVLKDSHHACEGCIVGYAFAWAPGARLSADKHPEVPLEDGDIKTAYIPIGHKGDQEQLKPDVVVHALKPVLESEAVGKVSFNAKLEMNSLQLAGILYQPLVFDPMLASYIVDPDENHRLREQAHRYFSYTLPNAADLIGSGKKQVTWDYLPILSASQFATDAARISLMLSTIYTESMDEDQKELLWDMEQPLSAVLAKMEQTGVKIDSEYFQALSDELGSELARLEGEIYGLAGHPFNIGSPLQLQTVLFQELKLPTKGKTKSGFSTDASVLDALSAEHAIVGKVLEWRHLSKLKSTYVDALPREISPRDGRLHGEFNQTSTATGRLSSTNPNLQNIPIRTEIGHRIRRGFVPRDDNHVIMSADYSQIELRLLAHMSGEENLIEAFQQDQDIHARTAADIFGIPINEVTSEKRGIGKTLNFALVYQQGAFATGQSLHINTRDAQEFINKYFAVFPKVRAFQAQVIAEARANGYVQTLWGRKRFFKNLNDRNDPVRKADERAAFNAPLQGSAADLIKRAMIRLEADLTSRGLQSGLILQVHDELVFDVLKEELEVVKAAIIVAMTADENLLRVPLKVDIGIGPNWMDAK